MGGSGGRFASSGGGGSSGYAENRVAVDDVTTKAVRERIRKEVAEHVEASVTSAYEPSRGWLEHEVVGPLGGISSQVVLAIGAEDGRVVPVVVSIYSDARIAGLLEERLNREDEERQLRKRLGWPESETSRGDDADA